MALVIEIIPYSLAFKFAARTSRGPMTEHNTWILKVWDDNQPLVLGYGECAPFEGLSIDHRPDYSQKIKLALKAIDGREIPASLDDIATYVSFIDNRLPSVKMGLETALRDLYYDGQQKIFDSSFYNQHSNIDINGLVWMGDQDEMLTRLREKVNMGYECVKIKIGALNFSDELEIIKQARAMNDAENLSLRVDANGAYTVLEAKKVLNDLAVYQIHSIEQPIKAGQREAMKELCATSPVPIALDEELIGISNWQKKKELLVTIKPQFIVLKPTLLGGFNATAEWIDLAQNLNIGWWITSALESNIGLNAICQFTAQYDLRMPQGLGTGGLYHNNVPSPLKINNGKIFLDEDKQWNFHLLKL